VNVLVFSIGTLRNVSIGIGPGRRDNEGLVFIRWFHSINYVAWLFSNRNRRGVRLWLRE